MLTYTNWLSTSLLNRKSNPRAPYEISMTSGTPLYTTFIDSVDYTCERINKNYTNLFLAFSGGLDSEFILRSFYTRNIRVTPIIVQILNNDNDYANYLELKNAYSICTELKIDPIVITISEIDLVNAFIRIIRSTVNGVGWNSTASCIAAEYAYTMQGTIITGSMYDGVAKITNTIATYTACEWDTYAEDIFSGIPFFLFTREIAFNMYPGNEYLGMDWQQYKSKLYNIDIKPKYTPQYTQNTVQKLRSIVHDYTFIKRSTIYKKSSIVEGTN